MCVCVCVCVCVLVFGYSLLFWGVCMVLFCFLEFGALAVLGFCFKKELKVVWAAKEK